jgi:hypothetical protein
VSGRSGLAPFLGRSCVVLVVVSLALMAQAGCDVTSKSARSAAGTAETVGQHARAEHRRLAGENARLRHRRAVLRQRAASPPSDSTRSTPPTPAASTSAPTPPTAVQPADHRRSVARSFASLQRRLGGSVGVAYAPVGAPNQVRRWGNLVSGVAWSTIKVPLAIASVRQAHGRPDASVRQLMRLAITWSDNNAALGLWDRLGAPATAAGRTEAVLRDGGDDQTTVPPYQLRPPYTPFGQSDWSLTSQARFAAALPCLRGSGPVLALMGQIIPDQSWGIGSLRSTIAFKGGWGPGADGRYLVRQLALVRLPNGARIGLTLASIAHDGTFASGIADLTSLARWAVRHIHTTAHSGC